MPPPHARGDEDHPQPDGRVAVEVEEPRRARVGGHFESFDRDGCHHPRPELEHLEHAAGGEFGPAQPGREADEVLDLRGTARLTGQVRLPRRNLLLTGYTIPAAIAPGAVLTDSNAEWAADQFFANRDSLVEGVAKESVSIVAGLMDAAGGPLAATAQVAEVSVSDEQASPVPLSPSALLESVAARLAVPPRRHRGATRAGRPV